MVPSEGTKLELARTFEEILMESRANRNIRRLPRHFLLPAGLLALAAYSGTVLAQELNARPAPSPLAAARSEVGVSLELGAILRKSLRQGAIRSPSVAYRGQPTLSRRPWSRPTRVRAVRACTWPARRRVPIRRAAWFPVKEPGLNSVELFRS